MTAGTGRWERWARPRVLVSAVVTVLVATVTLIVLYSFLLDRMSRQVEHAQARSANLSNADREVQVLLQAVTEFGPGTDPAELDLHRGVAVRQIQVSAASFDDGDPRIAELQDVRARLAAFPWDRLTASGGRDEPLRGAAMALVAQSEKRVNLLRSEQEKQFYAVTTASLSANQRGQLALATLVTLVLGLGAGGIVVVLRRSSSDVARANAELSHRAHHDPLTGLPNRTLLLQRLHDTLDAPGEAGDRVAVGLIDLDGFKSVNDTLGHLAGDELLRMAAQRLLGCLRQGDLAARLGGDEFAVLLCGQDRAAALAVARRIVDVLHEPFTVAGHQIAVGASVGVVHGPSGVAADDVLRDADIAMYAAKRTGKGRVEVFEPAMRVRASHRTRLQQELARAVEHGQIEVVYQPIVDLATQRPVLMEALARWRRPGRPTVSPDVFIALAEESGAIHRIGLEVLRQACRAAREWRRLPGYADLGVAVNVSVHQVLAGGLVDRVVGVLGEVGLPPAALALEITESAALGDSERVAAEFALLQAMGVQLAVDDFGAGYSSLGMLTGLDVDTLKIDRSLLDFDTTRRGSLVTAIAELGHTLGLRVIAEGVETAGHLRRAREACCDAVQGYFLSRPLEAPAVAEFLAGWTSVDRSAGAVA